MKLLQIFNMVIGYGLIGMGVHGCFQAGGLSGAEILLLGVLILVSAKLDQITHALEKKTP